MAFAFVPLHILNIIVSLLFSNHITQTFGKGIMPKRYELQADVEKLEEVFSETRLLARPGFTRLPLSGVFQEDKKENDWLLESEHDECGYWSNTRGSIGLGLAQG